MTGLIAWFTGLSGSGKSTIAEEVAVALTGKGITVDIIDGDRLRQSQAPTLGFSADDVMESNRLAIELASELMTRYDVILVPRISPLESARRLARQKLGDGFIEVFVRASIKTVRARDPKGLYAKAEKGQIAAMIGSPEAIPFEEPGQPDLVLDTESFDSHLLAIMLVEFLDKRLTHLSSKKCINSLKTGEGS